MTVRVRASLWHPSRWGCGGRSTLKGLSSTQNCDHVGAGPGIIATKGLDMPIRGTRNWWRFYAVKYTGGLGHLLAAMYRLGRTGGRVTRSDHDSIPTSAGDTFKGPSGCLKPWILPDPVYTFFPHPKACPQSGLAAQEMIHVWVGQRGTAGDFVTLLRMAGNLKLMSCLFLEFSI